MTANFKSLSVTNSTISNNSTPAYGAGIYNSYNATSCTIGGGTSIQGNGDSTTLGGGGIYVGSGSTVNVVSSTSIDSNTAQSGGGVYNLGTFNMTGGDISENQAIATYFGNGGGIYSSGTTSVTGTEMSTNEATNDGGGVYVATGTTTFDTCDFTANGAQHVGNAGAWHTTSTLTLTGCTGQSGTDFVHT